MPMLLGESSGIKIMCDEDMDSLTKLVDKIASLDITQMVVDDEVYVYGEHTDVYTATLSQLIDLSHMDREGTDDDHSYVNSMRLIQTITDIKGDLVNDYYIVLEGGIFIPSHVLGDSFRAMVQSFVYKRKLLRGTDNASRDPAVLKEAIRMWCEKPKLVRK